MHLLERSGGPNVDGQCLRTVSRSRKFCSAVVRLLVQIPVDISLTLESTPAIGGVEFEIHSYNSQSNYILHSWFVHTYH